jgi:hypothetical protein
MLKVTRMKKRQKNLCCKRMIQLRTLTTYLKSSLIMQKKADTLKKGISL